jgi:hypothetical protein
MWTFSEMYLEEKVLYNSDFLKIVDTLHSRERKQRQENQGRPVTDRDILTILQQTLPDLKKAYLDGEIPENRKVWLYDPKSRLNAIIEYDVIEETGKQKITILTVMRHNDFHNSRDTTKRIVVIN